MQVLNAQDLDGIADARANVLGLKIGVVIADDVLKGKALAHEFKNIDDGDSCAGNTGLAEMNGRIYLNAFCHDFRSLVLGAEDIQQEDYTAGP